MRTMEAVQANESYMKGEHERTNLNDSIIGALENIPFVIRQFIFVLFIVVISLILWHIIRNSKKLKQKVWIKGQ